MCQLHYCEDKINHCPKTTQRRHIFVKERVFSFYYTLIYKQCVACRVIDNNTVEERDIT